MHIVVSHPDPLSARAWRDALAALLPQARVSVDPAGGGPAAPPPVAPEAVADFAVGWRTDPDFFARHPALRAFFAMGAGVERLLADPRRPPALPVFRLEDAGMAWQMVEYCLHEVLRLRTQAARYEAQQAAATWIEHPARDRGSLRIGVFGLGVLGQPVAAAIAGLGYPVAGYVRTPRAPQATDPAGVTLYAGRDALPAFLARSDVLILLAPLTPDTANVIDAAALAYLPPGAWLVNVARGGLVDDAALLAALDTGHLAGATLDVFREEPLAPDHPFWRHPRVRLTPHVSAPTLVADSARQVADKIDRFSRGEQVGGRVDPARGY